MTPMPFHRRPSPPQPVEPENPLWMARFFQWLIDRVEHQDTCTDETKEAVHELKTELSTWMLTSRTAQDDIEQRVLAHINEHTLIDQTQASMKKQRQRWVSNVKDVVEFGAERVRDVIPLAIALYALLK